MKKLHVPALLAASLLLGTIVLHQANIPKPRLAPAQTFDDLRDAPNSLNGDVKQVLQDIKDDGRDSNVPAVQGAEVQAPAPAGPAGAAPGGLERLNDAVEHLCYEALQRFYYPNKQLTNLVTQLTYKFEGGFAAICDLNQPLFNYRQLGPGVFRSGRPTQEGFDQLKQSGTKTILDLAFDRPLNGQTSTESQTVAALGMDYQNVTIDWTKWPTYQELDQAMAILTDPSKQPVVFHCTCGRDRTGILAAAYRGVVQRWPPQQAEEEAKSLGWHFPACGDLAGFLSDYARYRTTGAVASPAANPIPPTK